MVLFNLPWSARTPSQVPRARTSGEFLPQLKCRQAPATATWFRSLVFSSPYPSPRYSSRQNLASEPAAASCRSDDCSLLLNSSQGEALVGLERGAFMSWPSPEIRRRTVVVKDSSGTLRFSSWFGGKRLMPQSSESNGKTTLESPTSI